MRILLVEDDTLKAERLLAFLSNEFPSFDVSWRRSYQTGLKAAESEIFDLLILDMTLPTFDVGPGLREGRSRSMGGREIMRKLVLKKVRTGAIVLTQFSKFGEGPDAITFEKLVEECRTELPGTFLGGVFYRASSTTWSSDLKTLVDAFLAAQ